MPDKDKTELYTDLTDETHFDFCRMAWLERKFLGLCDPLTMCIPESAFVTVVLSTTKSMDVASAVFRLFSKNNNSSIGFREYVYGLSSLCQGPAPERIKFVMQLWDSDMDGWLSRKDLMDCFKFFGLSMVEVLSNSALATVPDAFRLHEFVCLANANPTVRDALLSFSNKIWIALTSKTKSMKSNEGQDNNARKEHDHDKTDADDEQSSSPDEEKEGENGQNLKKTSGKKANTKNRPQLGGVQNIGNTCYMGAAIQTLANVSELTGFLFKNEQQFFHLPLVRRYIQMLRTLLVQRETASPLDLKEAISAKSALFAENVQHDSQEFMQFFLDALNESLKNIQIGEELENKKATDEGGRADDGNVQEDGIGMWQNANNHWKKEALTSKERSIVLDLFAGQFLSKLHCQNCAHSSNTFELFTMLQLQIPIPESICVFFKVVRRDSDAVVRHAMRIPSITELVHLKQLICERIGIATDDVEILIQNKHGGNCNADFSQMFNAKSARRGRADCTLMGIPLCDINIWCIEIKNLFADCSDCLIDAINQKTHTLNDPSLLKADRQTDARLLNVDDCVRDFTGVEQIDGSHCDNCKSSASKLSKQLSFTRLPDILVVCFKRFIFVPSLKRFVKQSAPLSFPLDNFDPRPYFAPDVPQQFLNNFSRYFCIGIVTHSGQLNYGHYCSYVLNVSSKRWFFCNDDKIELIKSGCVPTPKDAYILFYQRATDTPSAPAMRREDATRKDNNVGC
uniref:ubiquitinyl hydrolase 1 n=1 Tax=Globodera rostochiensis TaxID=31243 RepID=A0A914HTF6_GLORO